MAFVTSEYSIKSLFWLEKWPRTQKQAEFGQKRDQFRWAGIDLGVSQKNVRLGYLKLAPLSRSFVEVVSPLVRCGFCSLLVFFLQFELEHCIFFNSAKLGIRQHQWYWLRLPAALSSKRRGGKKKKTLKKKKKRKREEKIDVQQENQEETHEMETPEKEEGKN